MDHLCIATVLYYEKEKELLQYHLKLLTRAVKKFQMKSDYFKICTPGDCNILGAQMFPGRPIAPKEISK